MKENDVEFSSSDDENEVESSFSDDEELEVLSHLTGLLDSKKQRKVIWHNKQFEQPDFQWSHDTSTGDPNEATSCESLLDLFQKFFARQLYVSLAKETNKCFLMKTGKTCNVINRRGY